MKYLNPFYSANIPSSSPYYEGDKPKHQIGDFMVFSQPNRDDVVHKNTLIAQRVKCSKGKLLEISRGLDMYALQQNKSGEYVRPWNL